MSNWGSRPWTATGKAKQLAADRDMVIWHGVRNRCEAILTHWSDFEKRSPPKSQSEKHMREVVVDTSIKFGSLISFEELCGILLGGEDPNWAAWHLKDAPKYEPGVDRQRYLLDELDKKVNRSFPAETMSNWHEWWAEHNKASKSKHS